MNSRSKLALATFVATQSAGCHATWDIAPGAMTKLNGFRNGMTVQLQPNDTQDFTSDTELHFRGRDQIDISEKFSDIKVENGIFTGYEATTGQKIFVDLSKVSKIEGKNFSAAASVGLVFVSVGVVAPAAALTAIMVGIGGHPFGFGGGRPLRVKGRSSPVRAPILLQNARRRNDATRQRLLSHWAREASSESASIPAFLALARDLKLASAPSGLVRAALQAAREEAIHTQLCEELAAGHAGAPIAAMTPHIPASMDTDMDSLLQRLALEAFWDGCVAEGAAAAVARRSLADATDEMTQSALQVIARDETNHAELSRQILAYCLSTGGKSVRDVLGESLERRRGEQEKSLEAVAEAHDDDIDEQLSRHYGLASCEIKRAASIETWEKSISSLRV